MEPVSISSISLSNEELKRIEVEQEKQDLFNKKAPDPTYVYDLDKVRVGNVLALRLMRALQDYKSALIHINQFTDLLHSTILRGTFEPHGEKDKVLLGWYCSIGDVKIYVTKKIEPGFILLGYEP